MDIIEATNRTMLFDEINPKKVDILSLIGEPDYRVSIDDETIWQINDHLLVKNFDEFMNKFSPLDIDDDLIKMCIALLQTDEDESTGRNYEDVLSLSIPQKKMAAIFALRNDIHNLYEQYLLQKSSQTENELEDKIREVSQLYSNKRLLLPIVIEDLKRRLLMSSEKGNQSDKFAVYMLKLGENGELKIVERPAVENHSITVDKSFYEFFRKKYLLVAEDVSDDIVTLMLSVFFPLSHLSIAEEDIPIAVEKYNAYMASYKAMQSDYIKTNKPMIEKVLGVYLFFDQYRTHEKSTIPSLLITNCKLKAFVKNNNMHRIKLYLDTVNSKNDFRNTIWFGIVNDIEFNTVSNGKLCRERVPGRRKEINPNVNPIDNLVLLLKSISDYRIQLFFSFETGANTSAHKVVADGVDDFIKKTKALEHQVFSEYAIPCLPNVSLVPKAKSGILLARQFTPEGKESFSDKHQLKVYVDGIYIPVAYVAAGLVAACQCPAFLKTKLTENVNPDYPGVRFDLEASDYAHKVTTTLRKEISGFSKEIKQKIDRKCYGFFFSSEKDNNHVIVFKARSLGKLDGEYEKTCYTLTATYVKRILTAKTINNISANIDLFFDSNRKNSQKSIWEKTGGYENAIIIPGDDILHEKLNDESGKTVISFIFNEKKKLV